VTRQRRIIEEYFRGGWTEPLPIGRGKQLKQAEPEVKVERETKKLFLNLSLNLNVSERSEACD
jgi:hypothetical protein